MGYDLVAALFFIAITPLVIAGFILFWIVNASDREELARAWGAFANARGLELSPPEGEWPNRTAPAIVWTEERAELRITLIGREAAVRTRLTVRPRGSLLGTFAMELGERGSTPTALAERPARFGERILTERVMRMLLGFRQHQRVIVTYRRGRVAVEWPGGERNDARLDEARRLGAEIARTIDDEFRATERRAASARQPAA
jgi:hypothetical protein